MAFGRPSKPRQIKAWPDMTGLSPLLREQDLPARGRGVRFHIDFSHVEKVDAIGISIFLARLAQVSAGADEVKVSVSWPKQPETNSKLKALSLSQHLVALGLEDNPERSLFDLLDDSVMQNMLSGQPPGNGLEAEKIILIMPNPQGSRTSVIDGAKKEIKKFLAIDHERSFAHEQLMIILLEMVKNTVDHSGRPAFLGLSFKRSSNGIHFEFSYCDSGDGIGRSVRRHIEKVASEFSRNSTDSDGIFSGSSGRLLRLVKKGGLSDILHWALQPGNSTKSGNGVNFGLGLMLIVESARNCGIRLSLKDADSIWALTELSSPYSHSEIRQLGIKTCAAPLLMFHGEMERKNVYR